MLNVNWCNHKLTKSIQALVLGFMLGCSGSPGIQGGDISENFSGIKTATPISPTSIQLSWTLDSKISNYKIYQSGFRDPILNTLFSKVDVPSLTPGTVYQFAVSGVKTDSTEAGQDTFASATTLSRFTGLTQTNLVVKSANQVDVVWSVSSKLVKYNVFIKKGTASWDFTSPSAQISEATGTYSFSNLAQSENYCFYMTANYLDGTSEPATTDLSYVNTHSACVQTAAQLSGSIPTVSALAFVPGLYPWFKVTGSDPTYKIEIYRKADDILVASRTGDGYTKSIVKMNPGDDAFYSMVIATQGANEKARVEVLNPNNTTIIHSRNFKSGASAAEVFPPLMSGGMGEQAFGADVVSGDFNCDGLNDIAVSAPYATPYIDSTRNSQAGAVVIYYTEALAPFTIDNPSSVTVYRLKTGTPSVTASFPNPQLIYYPSTVSGHQFGQKLTVGNFNGDCFRSTNPTLTGNCDVLYNATSVATDYAKINRCQDLAVVAGANQFSTADRGEVFIIYGNPGYGLVTGAGAANYGLNELGCDPVSGVCRAVKMTYNKTLSPASNSVYGFGRSLTSGDFNNDGFDDLAVSSIELDSANNRQRARVSVLRGNASGLYPVYDPALAASSFAEILSDNNGYAIGTSDFGYSLGTAFNSRICNEATVTGYPGASPADALYTPERPREIYPMAKNGYDFSKCDDLVIGAPDRASDRGSIYSCIGTWSATHTTKISGWTCQENWPATCLGSTATSASCTTDSPTTTLPTGVVAGARFGESIIGVPNQNGYPIIAPALDSSRTADISGAVFVGAPYSNTPMGSSSVGSIFGYYITPYDTTYTLGFTSVIGASGAHVVDVGNQVACTTRDNNNTCGIQEIYLTTAQSGMAFGKSLSTIPDFDGLDSTRNMPSLAVGAPFRNYSNSLGQTIGSAGAVYLFRPDYSVLGYDTGVLVTKPKKKAACAPEPACSSFYGGGISPFGYTMFLPDGLPANSQLGLGGSGGANMNGTEGTDVFIAAPFANNPVTNNGAGYAFYSSSTGFSQTASAADIKITTNVSKELNYHFEMAAVVGDVNGDGYDDVMAKILVGSTKVQWIIYYGSIAGLITSPTPSVSAIGTEPKIIFSANDVMLGQYFFPANDINGDGFADILAMGKIGSYVFYGSSTGLVSGIEPTVNPVGKNPLWFARNGGSGYLYLHSNIQGQTTVGATFDTTHQVATAGDFNGDGYSDLAVGISSTQAMPAALDTSGLDYSSTNVGRVAIFYGSKSGLQSRGTSGLIKVINSPDTGVGDVVAKNPCTIDSATQEQTCMVQLISVPVASVGFNGVRFGWSLDMLPYVSSSGIATGPTGLVVGDYNMNSQEGRALVFKGSSIGLNPLADQVLRPPAGTTNGFGYNVSMVGDINGDKFPDVVINSPLSDADPTVGGNKPATTYVFYGSFASATLRFRGQTGAALTGAYSFYARNELYSSATPKVQVIRPEEITMTEGFGYGLSAVGDFDGDGFSDFAINVAKGNYALDSNKTATGFIIIYFGSAKGAKTADPTVGATVLPFAISSTPTCYGVEPTKICGPFQVFLPNNLDGEFTYLANKASGDINNDGLSDVILGAVGRNHPTGIAYSTGVIYVLY